MPATVIPVTGLYQGFIGDIGTCGNPLRVPRQVNPTDTNPIAFGETLVLNTNNTYSSVKQFIAGSGSFTNTTPFGLAKSNVMTNGASYPQNGGSQLAAGAYAPGQNCDALVYGDLWVFCANGTPTAGGQVFMRIALNASIPNGVVGGLEAVADGANTVALSVQDIAWKTGITQADGTTLVMIKRQLIP
jgi:hypothetical protein